MYRAPVDVVTGFLGSGKTTLLRRLLAAPAGRRVAVVVNELAGLDIDGRVLGGLRLVDRALEVPGGCLCCEIEESRLAAGIAEVLERSRPDLVVVETSGAADPAAAIERLRAAGLMLDAVVVMVDAEHGRRTLERHQVARAQVAAADFAIVNRIDLAPPGEADELERRIARLCARALVRRAVRADADLDLLFATGAARLRAAAARPAAGQRSIAPPAEGRRHGIDARVHRTERPVHRARLERALGALPDGVHRAKGIARVADAGLGLLFNVVRRRVELEWLPFATSDTQAVFIGEGLDRSWPGIVAALSSCEENAGPQDAGPPGAGTPGGGGRVA